MARLRLTPRTIAWALLAAGLALAAAVPDGPPLPRRSHDGFIILAGDFHVHSFPGDGSLPPWEIAREARRRGLDVVALTNHNSLLSSRLAGLLHLGSRQDELWKRYQERLAEAGLTRDTPMPSKAAGGCAHH